MILPASIWPYLWLLCSVLILTSLAANLVGPTRALITIIMACIVVRILGLVFVDGNLYLSLGSLVWAMTATTVLRLGHTTASGIILLSALCYYWASFNGVPRVVGSPPFVASDALLVAAMLWIGWHGVVVCVGRAISMVAIGTRDNRVRDNMVGP